ncbi:hypothetical protein SEVIR_7G198950v4 [Setaria viridis]|uniref:Uncharacterized protein n=1 Tax=Setaria viridis TaxID=4556 RepID=A0A4U6TSW8_SETVI|nr:hypothetical protein SEVIR_7G198950v2 [Setaria viridis]
MRFFSCVLCALHADADALVDGLTRAGSHWGSGQLERGACIFMGQVATLYIYLSHA